MNKYLKLFQVVISINFLVISLTSCIPAPPPPQSTEIFMEQLDLDPDMKLATEDKDQEVASTVYESCEPSNGVQPQENLIREWTGIVYEVKFGREDPSGISLGHDIDQRVSDNSDAQGCRQTDLTSPDGQEGIDNQFAKILPLVEAVGGEAIEGLAQGIINQGRLLMMFQLTALDDPNLQEDDCVHFESFYGLGTPHIGTAGFITSGQTFDRDPQRPQTYNDNLTINDGKLEVTNLELELPLEVFDQSYLFELDRVSISGQFTRDGEFHGFISGAIDVEAVAQRVEEIDGGGMVAEVIPRFLRQQADLDPDEDGICQSLSITLTFKAKKAYLFSNDESQP